MPGEEAYVDIRPIHATTRANCVHNAANGIRVNVAHSKQRKHAYIAAQPCERMSDGIVSILVTSGEYEVIEAMPRLNRKRLEILRSAMRNELSCRTGRAWDLVQKVCEKRGYTTP